MTFNCLKINFRHNTTLPGDHAIRTVHVNDSVHSSVSEHKESTKSAKYYTKMKTKMSRILIEEKVKLWKAELRFDEVSKAKTAISINPFVDQKDSQFPLDRFSSSPLTQHPGGSQVTTFKLAEAGMYRLRPQWPSIKEILTVNFLLIKSSLSQKSYRIVIILDTRWIIDDRGCEWAGCGQNS